MTSAWLPQGSVTVPAALAAIALMDGAFAGFRAATGRNARIDKRAYDRRAARRGLAAAAVALLVTSAVLLTGLLLAADAGQTYTALVHAGARMLALLLPFVAVAFLSLAAYWLLPMRASTFVILLGLGPFTLARPAVTLAASALAVTGSDAGLVWVGATFACAGVLLVEPWVHRRWYSQPY